MKTTINNKLGVITVALLLSGLVPSTMMAQDKVEASVGADLVSGYIWRGQNLGGVSVQPSLGISYKGLSLGAWGSVGIESKDAKEFDLTLGYSIGGFNVSITDYWFDNGRIYRSTLRIYRGSERAHCRHSGRRSHTTQQIVEPSPVY